MNELTPGTTIRGKYQIIDKVGAGGMASVYRARHLAFGEMFAIKVVGSSLSGNDDFLKRFKAEAIITRKLRHPNAVRVDDLDVTEDGLPYIVMEYVEGQSLRKVIQTEGPLSVPRSLVIARQVAAALVAAHDLGIIHRDIKPDNILLVAQEDGSELAKVLDFGIAKVREGSLDLGEGYTPTQTGVVVGTPQYISPEQAMGRKRDDIDGRADVYSLGVVLYEMLTGDIPFHADTMMGMILHHIQTPPRPPRDVRPDLGIPQTLSDLLVKCLAKDTGRRFQSAAELLNALNRPHDAGLAGAARPTLSRAPTVSSAAATAAVPGRGTAPTRLGPSGRPSSLLGGGSSTPARLEPIDVGGGGSLVPMRTLLAIGSVAFVLVGFVLLLPAPPAPRPPETTRRILIPPLVPPPVAKTAGPAQPAATDPPSGPATGDPHLLAEVRSRLAASEALKQARIEPVVQNGVVTLFGSGSAMDVEIATALARSVSGVLDVRSMVHLPPPAEATPPPADTPDTTETTETPSPEAPSVDPRALELVQEGRAALERGDIDGAIESFRAALAIDPEFAAARAGLRQAVTTRVDKKPGD